jgi:LmbE family N-acetylglucosaminyl deacetylase
MKLGNLSKIGISVGLLFQSLPSVQAEERTEPHRVILAVGAHAGDMEIACGAVLAKHVHLGDRVVLLHLTLGEGGNPRLSPEVYGHQKEREARAAAQTIGAEVLFGPYKDGEIPNDETARKYVADILRQVRPTTIITHWKHSIHKDHATAHDITTDAELLASLAGVKSHYPPYSGVKQIYFTENWEDKEGFSPYVYIDVSGEVDRWQQSIKQYEFIRGTVSSFPYFDYYKALARIRGAESGFSDAVAFDVDLLAKKQALPSLP